MFRFFKKLFGGKEQESKKGGGAPVVTKKTAPVAVATPTPTPPARTPIPLPGDDSASVEQPPSGEEINPIAAQTAGASSNAASVIAGAAAAEAAAEAAAQAEAPPSAEELCGIDPAAMDRDAIRAHLAVLYRRHNAAAASLNAELRDEAEQMLDAIVTCRETYVDHI